MTKLSFKKAFKSALANVDLRSLVTEDVHESMNRATQTLQQIHQYGRRPNKKESN